MELVSIYCRVSDSSQNDSIQNQLATIDSYCKQHGYIYDTPFIDSGKVVRDLLSERHSYSY